MIEEKFKQYKLNSRHFDDKETQIKIFDSVLLDQKTVSYSFLKDEDISPDKVTSINLYKKLPKEKFEFTSLEFDV